MAINNLSLRGVTVATVLPFDAEGAIDWRSYERLLRYCAVPDRTQAVFVNGHAGEGSALDDDERSEVIRCTRYAIGPDKPLLAGVVAVGIGEAVKQARSAEAEGADGIVIFPVDALGGTAARRPDGAVAYVTAITGAVSIPASLFQYPVTSGLGYSTQTLAALASLPNVIAVKEGSNDMLAYEENLRAIRSVAPDVAVLPSNYNWFMAQLAVGGDGILSGLVSLTPQWLSDLWEASEAADLHAMRAAADRLHPIVRTMYGPAPAVDMHTRIKVGLHAMGVIENPRPRAPLMPIPDDDATTIRNAVMQSGLTAEPALGETAQ